MFHVIWKDIPGWEGKYQISSAGDVKSLARKVPYQNSFRTQKEKILKPRRSGSPNKDGKYYLEIMLCDSTRRVPRKIHQLVAESFVPNPQALPLVMHKDDNPENNQKDNLSWGTVADNNKDRAMKGRGYSPDPEKSHLSKLTLEEAQEIYRLAHLGELTQEEIGKQFGIDQTVVSKIKLGIAWKTCSA